MARAASKFLAMLPASKRVVVVMGSFEWEVPATPDQISNPGTKTETESPRS